MKRYKSQINRLTIAREPILVDKVHITNSKDSAAYARELYDHDLTIYESFWLILLNRANNTVGFVKISQGGTTGTVADVKMICKYAVDTLAQAAICVHNHPSGARLPSNADKVLTRKVKEALHLFDCKLLDHIILTEETYYSFADEAQL